jgi:tungstate transport system substrate-binding protein
MRHTILLLVALALVGCKPGTGNVILATTTSTYDSGLLDDLVPLFEKRSGYTLKTIACGSGQAMAMGRRGEVDVLLVHSPAAEKEFMDRGYGSRRRIVMHNDFVLVGPGSDPAGVKGAGTIVEAFGTIAAGQSLFISRGDDSGTHARERAIWRKASLEPSGRWYVETGLGMGRTLTVASEKRGHTLADRGTYLALRDGLDLEILVQGDPLLNNVYHVIEVSASRFPDVNHRGAKAFSEFLLSPETQEAIRSFGVEKHGMPLFTPDAVR